MALNAKKVYAILRKKINGVASGIQSVTINSTNDGLLFTTTSGTTFDVVLPNFHSHTNLSLLEKFSYDSVNNELLYDGQPINKNNTTIVFKDYITNTKYKKDEYAVYDNVIYKVNNDFTSSDITTDTSNGNLTHYVGGTAYDDKEVKKSIEQINKIIGDINTLTVVGVTDVISAINKLDKKFMQSLIYHTDSNGKKLLTITYKDNSTYDVDVTGIITSTNLGELADVDVTSITDGQSLVYDISSGKFKPSTITGTDEKVKMNSSDTDSKYLNEHLDKVTVDTDSNNKIVAKTLDGLSSTITELNYLQGLTMPVQDLVNLFANGGLKYIDTPFDTYADLSAYDTSTLLDDIGYIARVLVDETRDSKLTAYLVKKDQTTPKFYGYLSESRDFTTNPIDLTTEITGKLSKDHIDLDEVLKALNISDEYKTLVTEDKAFGIIGAYNLYQEILTNLGTKVNVDDIIDDLLHDNSDKPLSAKQGKELKKLIDDITITGSGSIILKKELSNVTANTANNFDSSVDLKGYVTNVYKSVAGSTNLNDTLKVLSGSTKQDFIKNTDEIIIDDNGASIIDEYIYTSLENSGKYESTEFNLNDFKNINDISYVNAE